MVAECVQHIGVNLWFRKMDPITFLRFYYSWGMLSVNVYSNNVHSNNVYSNNVYSVNVYSNNACTGDDLKRSIHNDG
jgi:hypothetical protein